MSSDERDRELAAAWNDIRRGLGKFGDHLDDARAWVGDRGFLTLCDRFEAEHVIIACGAQNAADLLGQTHTIVEGFTSRDDDDARLMRAVFEAHQALGPRPPRSEEDKAIARKAFHEIQERE